MSNSAASKIALSRDVKLSLPVKTGCSSTETITSHLKCLKDRISKEFLDGDAGKLNYLQQYHFPERFL